MKTKKVTFEYSFSGKIWKTDGKGGWYFMTLPKTLSKKIRKAHKESEEGWGRLKTKAQINETSWETAIWFDTKADSFLLPVKSEIRKKESLDIDSKCKVDLTFSFDEWFWKLFMS